MELKELSITQAHKGLLNKEFSSKELTKSYLAKIEEKDKDVNSYVSVTKDLAISQAEKADKLISEKK